MVKGLCNNQNDGSSSTTFYNSTLKDNHKNQQRLFHKTIIALRIAMNKIGSIIDDIEDDWIFYELLMQHKRILHDQIDILIKEKKKKGYREYFYRSFSVPKKGNLLKASNTN
jgi:ParB family transcriptional regulator, chromosome partitioning protein